MIFAVAGLSFKTAPVEVRERLSFAESEIPEALSLLQAKDDVMESMILSTCNRVEIYALLKGSRVGFLQDFIRDFHKFSGSLSDILYVKSGENAVKHLCMVASGLDSMVLGEPQIFGQVKDAYARCMECNSVGYAFEHLMSQVFSVVKKVRSRTKIGESNISVSYAAVKLAHEIFGNLGSCRVMILGAGEMGEQTVRSLISHGSNNIIVANRTFSKAVELAEKFKGTPVMLHEIGEYLPHTDILISSVSSPSYVLNAGDINNLIAERQNRPLFLVDISVPRSLDPDIGSVCGCHLYNIDGLRAISDASAESRRCEAQKAIAIIDSKKEGIFKHIRSYDIIPTMVSIRTSAEQIRKDGLKRSTGMLDLSEKELEHVDSLTRSIVNKILHDSEVKFREYSNTLKKV
ncbi:MAG: glutamyl-tRNA reductase [Chitinispirillales bacterium]|jgi:glutamyl-tRNA reductase|nr:glutamyl-tRNA reductase [Chitinispirillales bacterium]